MGTKKFDFVLYFLVLGVHNLGSLVAIPPLFCCSHTWWLGTGSGARGAFGMTSSNTARPTLSGRVELEHLPWRCMRTFRPVPALTRTLLEALDWLSMKSSGWGLWRFGV